MKTTNDLPIFYEAEQIGVTKVLVAYFDRHINIIDDFINTMHSDFINDYGSDLANKVFGFSSSKPIQRSPPKSTWNFFKNITGTNKSNPQAIDETMNMSRRANGYYGNAPIETDANDENVFGVKSYSKVVTQPNDHDEVVRLSQLVDDLVTQVDALKQNVTKDVTEVVLKDVDRKIDSLETRVNEQIERVETNCNSQLEIISQQYNNILSQMNTNNSFLLSAIRGENVTPSGVDESARGGAE